MRDKRRFRRFDETVVTTYEIPKLEDTRDLRLRERPCWLREISEGGALLETTRKIPVRSPIILHITVTTETGDDVYMSVRGETRWLRGVEKGNVYNVGVEFKIMSDADSELLRAYISKRVANV